MSGVCIIIRTDTLSERAEHMYISRLLYVGCSWRMCQSVDNEANMALYVGTDIENQLHIMEMRLHKRQPERRRERMNKNARTFHG